MVVYNAITNTTTGSVLRYGACTLVAGAGETLTSDVGHLPTGEVKYIKIVGGVCVVMDAAEKIVVDDAEEVVNAANSDGALFTSRCYAPADLPATPARDGLVVCIHDSGTGQSGIAVSMTSKWYTVYGTEVVP